MKTSELESRVTSQALRFYRKCARSNPDDHANISLEDVVDLIDSHEDGMGIMVASATIARDILQVFTSNPGGLSSRTDRTYFLIFADGSVAHFYPDPDNYVAHYILKLGRPFDFARDFAHLGTVRVAAATPALRSQFPDLQAMIDHQTETSLPYDTSYFQPIHLMNNVFAGRGEDLQAFDFTDADADALIAALQICWDAVDLPPHVYMSANTATNAGEPLSIYLEGEIDHESLDGEARLIDIVSLFVDPKAYLGFYHEIWRWGPAIVVDADREWHKIREFSFRKEGSPSNHRRMIARATILEACAAQGRHDLAKAFEADWTLGFRPDH